MKVLLSSGHVPSIGEIENRTEHYDSYGEYMVNTIRTAPNVLAFESFLMISVVLKLLCD